MMARVELEPGLVLYAGARGERWLYRSEPEELETAGRLAPEDLVAALPAADSGWLFVGKSGAVYESKEPLGDFERSTAPMVPLKRVAAGAGLIVGIDDDGRLQQTSDSGVTWRPIGPSQVLFEDLAVDARGRALALGVPEQIWASLDRGKTWKRADVASVGALELRQDASYGFAVRAALGDFQVELEPTLRLESRSVRFATLEPALLKKPPPRGPDADALARGRAAVSSGHYFEVAPGKVTPWVLWTGPIDQPLAEVDLPELRRCHGVRLAAFRDQIYLSCFAEKPSQATQPVTLYYGKGGLSAQGKRAPLRVARIELRAAPNDFLMAAGRDALLLAGVCPRYRSRAGCSPHGVHRYLPARGHASKNESFPGDTAPRAETRAVEAGAAPGLKSVLGLAFSPDGRRAFIVGRRDKSDGYVLYVSDNGGKSFEAVPLPGVEAAVNDADDAVSLDSLSVSEEGAVALVLKIANRRLLVVASETGRVLSLARPPGDATLLGAVGSRAVAIAPLSRAVWESLDGGTSFHRAGRLPSELCPGDRGCDVPVQCFVEGCVIGDELTRLGWQSERAGPQKLLPPAQVADQGFVDRHVKTPLHCALGSEPWQTLENANEAPGAQNAALGNVAWTLGVEDAERAAVAAYHARGGARPRVEKVVLLPPSSHPEALAYTMTDQIEGTAAFRYALPSASDTRLSRVEVAWDNRLLDQVMRQRMPDAGDYVPGDFERVGGGVQRAKPALLSIGGGGIYLRPHKAPPAQPTYFLDGRSVVELPEVAFPRAQAGNLRQEMSRADDVHLPLLIDREGSFVVRARLGGAQRFDAFALGLSDPKAFDMVQFATMTYVGTRPAFHVFVQAASGRAARGWVLPLSAGDAVFEPALPAPSQLDLADPPAACDEAVTRSAPRLVVPLAPGTRHPIQVSDPSEPIRLLLSGWAVLYPTPGGPCMAALDAEGLPEQLGGTGEDLSALLLLADLKSSWLFRRVRDEPGAAPRLEYRPMSCRFDAGLRLPPEVLRAPGTAVLLER